MNRGQWLQYYSGMAQRQMKESKRAEMVKNCGILEKETIDQAADRIMTEIKALPTDTDLETRVKALEDALEVIDASLIR